MASVEPRRLVFLDECGVLTNLVPRFARSPRGTRAYGRAPFGRWRRLSVLGALGLEGIIAAMSIEAATSEAVFLAYLAHVLLPALREAKPDAVLVMDNLSAHKTKAVRALLDQSGFAYRYLPPYSPELNPIEQAWAKPKGQVRRMQARSIERLNAALGSALDAITPNDAQGFFYGCGCAGVST